MSRGGLFGLALLLSSLVCQADPTAPVSGPWDASPLQVSWAIGTWGPTCGEKPGGGGDGGGTVTLTATGSDFTWSGLGRTYSSSTCWEQMPGLQTRSHSASATTIRTTCEMPKGDPRQTKLVTTWALRGDKIYFDETAQYQFVGKETACTASARRTRLLSRSTPEPETAPEGSPAIPETIDEKAPVGGPVVTPKPASCTGQEVPETIALTPHASVLRGGDRLDFDVVVRGAHGCPLREKPRIEITRGQELIEVGAEDVFRVLPGATSGQVSLRASAGNAEATASILIVSQKELSDLLGDVEGPEPGSNPPAHTDASTSTEAQGESDSKRDTILGILLAAVVGCGALLYWFRRPQKKEAVELGNRPPAQTSEPPPEAHRSPVDPGAKTVAEGELRRPSHPVERSKGRLCPVCGERYPMETVFCGKDGARLVREN